MELTWLLLACIALLVLFDFTNGFNDTANMVATVIACRAMTPAQAILLVSLFTFLGPVLGGTAVADTIGGFITLDNLPASGAIVVLLSGAIGAISVNLLTWWRGLPSSSSHALIGGLCGAVLVAAGGDHGGRVCRYRSGGPRGTCRFPSSESRDGRHGRSGRLA